MGSGQRPLIGKTPYHCDKECSPGLPGPPKQTPVTQVTITLCRTTLSHSFGSLFLLPALEEPGAKTNQPPQPTESKLSCIETSCLPVRQNPLMKAPIPDSAILVFYLDTDSGPVDGGNST